MTEILLNLLIKELVDSRHDFYQARKRCWVAYMGGLHKWPTWVAYMSVLTVLDALHGWPTWMAYMGGLAVLGDLSGWPTSAGR